MRDYELIIDCTNKCISKCTYCGTDSDMLGERYLDYDVLRSILVMAKELSVHVYLGGGCFFCYPYWKEILEFNRELKADITIDVPLAEMVLNSVTQYQPQEYNYTVSISLWGINSVHDSLSGLNCFELFNRYSQLLGDNMCVSFVMTQELLSIRKEIINFINDNCRAKSIYFHRLMPTGRCSKENVPDLDKIRRFRDSLLVSIKNAERLRFHHTLSTDKCNAFYERLFVDWDGNIFGCGWVSKNTKPVANIRETDLYEIIQNSKKGVYKNKTLCPLVDF